MGQSYGRHFDTFFCLCEQDMQLRVLWVLKELQVDSKNPGEWKKIEGIEFDKDLICDLKTVNIILDSIKAEVQTITQCIFA